MERCRQSYRSMRVELVGCRLIIKQAWECLCNECCTRMITLCLKNLLKIINCCAVTIVTTFARYCVSYFYIKPM